MKSAKRRIILATDKNHVLLRSLARRLERILRKHGINGKAEANLIWEKKR